MQLEIIIVNVRIQTHRDKYYRLPLVEANGLNVSALMVSGGPSESGQVRKEPV